MNLEKLKFVTALHFYATGPGQELHQWLSENQADRSMLIEHPFPFSSRNYARIENVDSSGNKTVKKLNRKKLPVYVGYMLDFFRTLRILSNEKFDVYVGNGCFDTLAGIVARWLGKTDKVVLYTIDYAPNAGGKLYGLLYRTIDRFCCYHVDAIWNLSDRMHEARLADGMNKKKCAPAIRVPHGTHAKKMRSLIPENPDKYSVAFMGHILKKSGLQLFMRGMKPLLDEMPEIHLEILGGGEYLDSLKSLSKELNIEKNVTFYGFIESHDELEKKLAQCGIGLALYSPDEAGFSYCADPGKLKVYLACGLPIIVVGVPQVADEIDAFGAGVKIEYDIDSMSAALKKILDNYSEYKKNALKMAEEYDWDNVFRSALDKSGRLFSSA